MSSTMESPTTPIAPAAAKPPSTTCPGILAIAGTLLALLHAIVCAILSALHDFFPFNRIPQILILCIVQAVTSFLGLTSASVTLCCAPRSAIARSLLTFCAIVLIFSAIVLAPLSVSACAYKVRAMPDDWLAFHDETGQPWRYADRCSGDYGHFSPLPLFIGNALAAIIGGAGCIHLYKRLRRIDAFVPADHVALASAKPQACVSLVLFLVNVIWAAVCLGMLANGSLRQEIAPNPPPRPPFMPPAPSPTPPPPPRPGWPGRFVGRWERPGPPPPPSWWRKNPPPPSPAPPASPLFPPTPVWPAEEPDIFTVTSGPCKVVGRCVTSSKYEACVDHRVCIGPSCVGPPCPGTHLKHHFAFPPPPPLPPGQHDSYDSYSYDDSFNSYDVIMEEPPVEVDTWGSNPPPPPPLLEYGRRELQRDGIAQHMMGKVHVLPAAARGVTLDTSTPANVDPEYAYLRKPPDASHGYENREYCSITIKAQTFLEVAHFDTESCCDKLTVPTLYEPDEVKHYNSWDRPMMYSAQTMSWRNNNEGPPGMAPGPSPPRVMTRQYAGHGTKYGPDGVLAAAGTMTWRSDGGVTASGWAVCAAGATDDVNTYKGELGPDGTYHFTKPGLTYPWHEFVSATYFGVGTLLAALLGLFAALLACCQPLPVAAYGTCCKGRRYAVCARILAFLSAVGHLLACIGLVRTATVACLLSAHHCARLLPFWWVGTLLCMIGMMVGVVLVLSLAPPPSDDTYRLEDRLANYLKCLSLITTFWGTICVIVNATVHPFYKLPGLFVFSSLTIIMPFLGMLGACLLPKSRRAFGRQAGASGNDTAIRRVTSKPSLIFLALNTVLVGSAVIGLPITASGGYGAPTIIFLIGAAICLADSALSLALCVLVCAWSTLEEHQERAGLARADSAALEEQLASSERRQAEMDRKMEQMMEQQARMMEMLGQKQAAEANEVELAEHVAMNMVASPAAV